MALVKRYAHVNSETYLESINAMPSLQNWADSGQKNPTRTENDIGINRGREFNAIAELGRCVLRGRAGGM